MASVYARDKIEGEFIDFEQNDMISVPEYFGMICGENERMQVQPGGASSGIWNDEVMGTRMNSNDSENACNEACSQDPNCNFASHQILCQPSQTTDGEDVDQCEMLCEHSTTCDNPIRLTHENTYVKASYFNSNPIRQTMTFMQVLNWVFLILIVFAIFYAGKKYLKKYMSRSKQISVYN